MQGGLGTLLSNEEELKDFIREVVQCKVWLRLRGDFKRYDEGEREWGSSFASYWQSEIAAHAHQRISVGAVIAAAMSLGLVVERDGWGCFIDNGYFDANIFMRRPSIGVSVRKIGNTT
jgi:hypothetical protein